MIVMNDAAHSASDSGKPSRLTSWARVRTAAAARALIARLSGLNFMLCCVGGGVGKKPTSGAVSAGPFVERDLEELLNFFDLPDAHWKKVRTTNVIERAFRESAAASGPCPASPIRPAVSASSSCDFKPEPLLGERNLHNILDAEGDRIAAGPRSR